MSNLQHEIVGVGEELPCELSKVLHTESFAKTQLRVFYYEHDDE